MKTLLLALTLCTVSFAAQAAKDNIICSVNNKTITYENVDVYFRNSGSTNIITPTARGIEIGGLYTCIRVIRDRDGWEAEWEKVKALMQKDIK